MWCPGDTMTDYSYILFNQTPEQVRRIGALGGKAHARNPRSQLIRTSNRRVDSDVRFAFLFWPFVPSQRLRRDQTSTACRFCIPAKYSLATPECRRECGVGLEICTEAR